MIAYEVMHYLKRKTQEKVGFTTLKIDISKTYDHLEWGYLKDYMLRMGFASGWIELVMLYVTVVKYHVLYDLDSLGPITP